MELNDLSPAALDAAVLALQPGPVAMVNLVRFRDEVAYPDEFEPRKTTPRKAYYEGYAGTFREVAKQVGVSEIEVIFRGQIAAGLVASADDSWDDVVIVKYPSFGAFRQIVESREYKQLAAPHRRAAVRDWRLFAIQI